MGHRHVQAEDWNSHDHHSIYTTAQSFQSGNVTAVQNEFNAAAFSLYLINTAVSNKVQGILGKDWRGRAAEDAQQEFAGYFKDSDSAAQAVAAFAKRLPPLGHAMDAAKAAIQPPYPKGASTQPKDTTISEAQDHARWQMNSLFSQPVVDAGRDDDDLTVPRSNFHPGTPGVPKPTGVDKPPSKTLGQVDSQLDKLGDIGKTNPAFDQGPGGDQQSAGAGQGAGSGSPGGSSGSGGGTPGGGSSGGLGSGLGSGLANALNRRGTPVPDDGYLTKPSSWLQDPLGRDGGMRPDSYIRGGADSNPYTGQPGGGAGAASAARGATGMTGMSGMMGAGAPGHGRGGKEDEGEHRLPHFLISADNGNEFIGELPKASPPVIGDWSAHERDDPDYRD